MLGLHLLVSTNCEDPDSTECIVVVSYLFSWTRVESSVEGFSVFVPAPYIAWGTVFCTSKLENKITELIIKILIML